MAEDVTKVSKKRAFVPGKFNTGQIQLPEASSSTSARNSVSSQSLPPPHPPPKPEKKGFFSGLFSKKTATDTGKGQTRSARPSTSSSKKFQAGSLHNAGHARASSGSNFQNASATSASSQFGKSKHHGTDGAYGMKGKHGQGWDQEGQGRGRGSAGDEQQKSIREIIREKWMTFLVGCCLCCCVLSIIIGVIIFASFGCVFEDVC